MNKQKGFVHLILLTILALVITGIGYWGYKSRQLKIISLQKQPTVSPTLDTTANWKTYKSQDFSFKYPNNWQEPIEELISTGIIISIKDGKEAQHSTVKLDITDRFYYNQEKNRELTLNEFINHYLKNITAPIEISKENISINSWNGYKLTYSTEGKYVATDIFISESPDSTRIISIHYRHDGTEYNSSAPETFNQILSTFRFLASDSQLDLWSPVCKKNNSPNFNIDVEKGDGKTHIARKAVNSYINLATLTNIPSPELIFLSPEEKVYAEDFVRKRITIQNLSVGKSVPVPCNTVEEAVVKARLLTVLEKRNLQDYSSQVEKFGIEGWLRQVVEESSKDLKFKPGIIGL